jgi:hypothetical protein
MGQIIEIATRSASCGRFIPQHTTNLTRLASYCSSMHSLALPPGVERCTATTKSWNKIMEVVYSTSRSNQSTWRKGRLLVFLVTFNQRPASRLPCHLQSERFVFNRKQSDHHHDKKRILHLSRPLCTNQSVEFAYHHISGQERSVAPICIVTMMYFFGMPRVSPQNCLPPSFVESSIASQIHG